MRFRARAPARRSSWSRRTRSWTSKTWASARTTQVLQARETTLPVPYTPEQEQAIDLRSRNIMLTDDYAPVENLLAPVAETRGTD